MKIFAQIALGMMLMGTVPLAATETLDAEALAVQAYLLGSETLNVNGEFSNYDFPGVTSAFDWTFTTSANTGMRVFQLQGVAPSESDVFGWKEVSVIPNTVVWYMSYIGDWDHDGDGRFDWVLTSNGTGGIYKLSGVSDSGNFAYSSPIDIPYQLSEDQRMITFGDANTPRLDVTFPNTGSIVIKAVQTNGSGYMDYYGTRNGETITITRIVGSTGQDTFEYLYSEGKISVFKIDNLKVTYAYNVDGTVDLKFYSDDVLQFEDTNAVLRALSKEEECDLQKKSIAYAFLTLLKMYGSLSPNYDVDKVEYTQRELTARYMAIITIWHSSNFARAIELYKQECTEESSSSSSSSESGLDVIALFDGLVTQFDDLYAKVSQCSSTYDKSSYSTQLNPGIMYCRYTNGELSSIIARDFQSNNDDLSLEFYVTVSDHRPVRMWYHASNNFDYTAELDESVRYDDFRYNKVTNYSSVQQYRLKRDYANDTYTFYDYIGSLDGTYDADGKLIP